MVIFMNTTPDVIKMTAKHLSSVPNEVLQIFIDDASLEVSSMKISEENKQRLIRYLATHLASLSNKTVKKEKVDGLEREYSVSDGVTGLDSTQYGQEYLRLLESFTRKNKLNLTVI
jgi:hypothetical protein